MTWQKARVVSGSLVGGPPPGFVVWVQGPPGKTEGVAVFPGTNIPMPTNATRRYLTNIVEVAPPGIPLGALLYDGCISVGAEKLELLPEFAYTVGFLGN